MARAMYPEDTKGPPPYSIHDGMNTGATYQQQVPPPVHSPNFVSPPPPFPVYAQTTLLYPTMAVTSVGRSPVSVQCPRCHQQVVTVVQYETGAGTWLVSLLICLFGGIFGCCLIPFCVPGCQDAVHTCPSCRSLIGRRNVF